MELLCSFIFNMKQVLAIVLIVIPNLVFSQVGPINISKLKWEASIGSGLYLDLFYSNLIFGGDNSVPPSYSVKKGRRINPGITNRIEIKYLLNKKAVVSFYFQNSRYNDLIGSGNDPLEVWTELKRNNRRMHFTINYYRIIPSGIRGEWSVGSGFQVQIEKVSFPYYRNEDPSNPTLITDIGARPYWTYFEDWAIPLTVAHHWTINKNLKLGLMLNTAYTMGTGVDGLSLLGNIAIPFGNTVKGKEKK
jgi:hypothetical protein